MKNNPYTIDHEDFKVSREIKDPILLLKLEICSQILRIIKNMDTAKALEITKLHKSDLSRIRAASLERFSIDRLVLILGFLGYKAELRLTKDKKAS